MLKSYRVGWWGAVVAHEILVSAQGPVVFGFGVLGLTVWGQGLTISHTYMNVHYTFDHPASLRKQFISIRIMRIFIFWGKLNTKCIKKGEKIEDSVYLLS